MLEAWRDIERSHMLDVSVIKDYLHAVVCTIPLIEGAKVDLESVTMAFEDTSHMVATIQSMLSSVSPTAHETMVTLSELADVVTQEKLLLEECFEHLEIISTLEVICYEAR
ncbi:putative QWRF family protein [Helianthus annuus]|nr:putative QWRF family protein [Helianthus annuus]